MDDLSALLAPRTPTASRPLSGMTILAVEDSRFACESLRLMSLRSGARIRRADCLASARRHLKVYRPSAVIVDMGLPDGSGLDLIEELGRANPRVGVILGLSGDATVKEHALRAGADGFLAKPLESLAQFQAAVLCALPADRVPQGPRGVTQDRLAPDRSAYRDDISHAAALLATRQDRSTIDYAAQFLGGIARSARDCGLERAASDLAQCRPGGGRRRAKVAQIMQMLHARMQNRAAI